MPSNENGSKTPSVGSIKVNFNVAKLGKLGHGGVRVVIRVHALEYFVVKHPIKV